VTNFWGRKTLRRAFTAGEGYFPVSRMVSTFPSASDVAWTDIFGDRPLPGYQRTYFSVAANSQISINGVTTTMEHEHQMDFQLQNGFFRALGYMCPVHTYRLEAYDTFQAFRQSTNQQRTFYAYLRATDDSQHLDRDIFAILCDFDRKLQKLRADYKAQTGHDLEIVILSDHGHNHAGRGLRVRDGEFLKHAGYHVGKTIAGPKDVVLPIVGIEDWVEIHCAPSEAEKLTALLCGLKGAELLCTPVFGQTNRFLVLNTKSERAYFDWNPVNDSYRYSPESGDPLEYRPVVEALKNDHQLAENGFSPATAWMAATTASHYPVALERIRRGLTWSALNPATILISLDNRYVNANWLTQAGSRLVTCRSTHGGLDDLNSDGILLSNFQPTQDTLTDRVAGQFGDFTDVKNFRAYENGAEWVTRREQALTRIAHVPFDHEFQLLPGDGPYLRVWSPALAGLDGQTPLHVTIEKVSRFSLFPTKEKLTLSPPLLRADTSATERIYALPAEFQLEPQTEYKISGWIEEKRAVRLCTFNFHTNRDGLPAPY